jgi:uncharacterized membrane protein YhaH (DUF805 family)
MRFWRVVPVSRKSCDAVAKHVCGCDGNPLVVIPPIASCLAILVKRLHDRNKSAGGLLLFAIGASVMETVASDLDSRPTVVLMFLSIAIWL